MNDVPFDIQVILMKGFIRQIMTELEDRCYQQDANEDRVTHGYYAMADNTSAQELLLKLAVEQAIKERPNLNGLVLMDAIIVIKKELGLDK